MDIKTYLLSVGICEIERSWSVVSADGSCYLLFSYQLTETQTRSSRQASDHKSHQPPRNSCPPLTELTWGSVKGFSEHKQQMQQPSAQNGAWPPRYEHVTRPEREGKQSTRTWFHVCFYYQLFRVHHGKAFWTPPLKTLWAPGGGFHCTRRVLPPPGWTMIFFTYKWWIWSWRTDPTPRETRKVVRVAGGELERRG